LPDMPVEKITYRLSPTRLLNIVFRTAHIAVIGVLFGGHVFGMESERLLPWLYLTIATGSVLVLIEAYPSWRWCFQGRAVVTFAKLLLLCLVPWLWSYRVLILIVVIALGSAGSHMPRWFRYYSLVDRQVVGDAKYSITVNDSPRCD
jgi:hypothetical protein